MKPGRPGWLFYVMPNASLTDLEKFTLPFHAEVLVFDIIPACSADLLALFSEVDKMIVQLFAPLPALLAYQKCRNLSPKLIVFGLNGNASIFLLRLGLLICPIAGAG